MTKTPQIAALPGMSPLGIAPTPTKVTGPFSVYENAPGNRYRFLILDGAGQTVAMTTGSPDQSSDYYRAQANARLIADALNRAPGAA